MSDYSELKRLADLALAGSQSEGEAFRSACRASVIGRLIDERDQLKAEVEALRKGWYLNEFGDNRFWPEEMEELRKDAERYRCLIPPGGFDYHESWLEMDKSELDAALDEIMTKEQPK